MYRNVTGTYDRCNIANGSIGHTTRSYVKIFPFGRISIVGIPKCVIYLSISAGMEGYQCSLFFQMDQGTHLERVHSNTHGFCENCESVWVPIIRHFNFPGFNENSRSLSYVLFRLKLWCRCLCLIWLTVVVDYVVVVLFLNVGYVYLLFGL